MSTQPKKLVYIDEKIKIFERFSKTGEKLTGKTIFEGHTIGNWAIQIRNQVNRGMKLTDEQYQKLQKLGILQKQKEKTIDEKIEDLVKWVEKYPDISVVMKVIPQDKIGLYAETEEEINDIQGRHYKMHRYYEYVKNRRAQGKLTAKQIEKCKEGSVGGVFGLPNRVLEIARKYRINPNKMEYIISKYGTIDNFVTAYRKGKLDFEDRAKFEKNIKNNFEVNLKHNANYDMLLEEIFGRKYITEENLNFYDTEEVNQALQKLLPREREVLIKKYGLETGKARTIYQIGEEQNVTHERIRQIVVKALKKLRNPIRASMYDKKRINHMESMTPDEINTINEIKDIIFSSNCIFYPDPEYKEEPDNIDKIKYFENIKKIEQLFKERDSQGAERIITVEFDTPIEEMDMSFRAFTRLKKYGINTIGELKNKPHEELLNIEGFGRTSITEVMYLLKNYRISEKGETKEKSTDNETVQEDNNVSEIEQLRRKKEELMKQEKKLEEQEFEAKELLAQYKKLNDEKTTENPDFKGE